MKENEKRIGPLKKIAVTFEIESSSRAEGTDLKPYFFEFIFGLSSGGLAPLENQLFEKEVGEEIPLNLHQSQIKDFFGHLNPHLNDFRDDEGACLLRVRVEKISSADPREIIRELASLVGCGDHCCGEGGHEVS